MILRKPNCVVGKMRLIDGLFFLAVLADLARVAVSELAEYVDDLAGALDRDLPPLVAEAAAHLDPKRGRVDQLDLAPARRRFAVCHHPDIGRDPRIVEKLLGQRDQGFEQIILKNEAADFALAAAGVAGEERRAVHDDRDPASHPRRDPSRAQACAAGTAAARR